MNNTDQFEDALRAMVDCVREDYPNADQVDVVIHTDGEEYVMSTFVGGRDV